MLYRIEDLGVRYNQHEVLRLDALDLPAGE